MTAVFVDTSAAYALLVSTDSNHARAARTFAALAERKARLWTSSYALVETYALLGHRVGLDAVAAFRIDFAPLLDVVWVDAKLHDAALDLLLERDSRKLSLVDAVSFLVIKRRDMEEVFTYDRDFAREGVSVIG